MQTFRYRSSHHRCSIRKGVPKNFTKFTGKQLCQSLFFNKVACLRPAASLKKGLRHRCFPVNFARFLRTPILQNTSGWLLLQIFTAGPVMFVVTCLSIYLTSILFESTYYSTLVCLPWRYAFLKQKNWLQVNSCNYLLVHVILIWLFS